MSLVSSKDMFWLLMLAQPLHGVTFALMICGSTEFLTSLPGEMFSTSSTIINTLFFVVGHGVGNIFWLKAMDMKGDHAESLYLLGAGIMLIDLLAGGLRDEAGGGGEGGGGGGEEEGEEVELISKIV
jgi:hypothetical protein